MAQGSQGGYKFKILKIGIVKHMCWWKTRFHVWYVALKKNVFRVSIEYYMKIIWNQQNFTIIRSCGAPSSGGILQRLDHKKQIRQSMKE